MAQQNALINGSLSFSGSFAGQATLQAQPIGGNLIFQLPNIVPVANQIMIAESINGNVVTLGFAAAQSVSFSGISGSLALTQISTAGASSGDVIQFNGTNWAVSSSAPGSGTVTSVALTAPAIFAVGGSPITSSGTLAITLATQSANTVWAGPATGAAAAPTFRALVAADIPSLPYLSNATVLPANTPAVAHEFFTAYNSTSGAFTAAQPASTDLSDSASLARLASPTFTGIVSVGAITLNATSGAVSVSSIGGGSGEFATFEIDTNLIIDTTVTFNATATLTDGAASVGTNGQLLSSNATGVRWLSQSALTIAESQVTGLTASLAALAPLASPTFTGTVTLPAVTLNGVITGGGSGVVISDTSATGISITESGAGNLTLINGGSAVQLTPAAGVTMGSDNGSVAVSAVGAISLTPNSGQITTVSGHISLEGVTSTGATGTGNIVFSAAPTFTGTVNGASLVLTGTLVVEGLEVDLSTNSTHLVGNSDIAGTVTITGPSTSGGITFTTPYIVQPKAVQLTPLQDITSGGTVINDYWVTSFSQSGFTANVAVAPGTTFSFYYTVIG